MAKRLISTGGELTEDLLTEVLLKLPIKLLLQLKSVSKSWLALISSNRFAKSHLLTNTAGDDETRIVHIVNDEENEEEDGSFALFNHGSGHVVKNLQFPYSQDEYYPFVPQFSELVGSDCGILCVSVDVSNWRASINKSDIYLWNPATKHSKRIPPHTILDNDDDKTTKVALGFGFDRVDFDFKVVRVASPTISAEVYSSNKNAWRKIEPNPTDTSDVRDFNVCIHGFLFGMGSNFMMAFDLNKEVFICNVKLPCYIKLPVNSFDVRISEFNDSVAVFMYDELDEKVKLWTLNDEACLRGGEVEASWTMMLSIDVGIRLIYVEGLFDSVEFFLMDYGGERFLYNFNNKGTKDVPNFPFFDTREVFKYTESLFSIVGSKRIKCNPSSLKLQHESDLDAEMDEESIPN